MKAIVYTKYGSPDVLALKEVDKPVAKDNEVLVRIHAASINAWDWGLLTGKPFMARVSGGGLRKPKATILGCDIAGQVEAVGANVSLLHVGDEVFGDLSGSGFGAFAEYACVREDVLALKPTNLTFEQAAAVPQAAVIALQGVRDKGHVQQGQKVLVNGAGGGAGSFAVQIAKSFGAEVTGVDNANKLDGMRAVGADHVIDYTREDFTQGGELYDLIVDLEAHHSIFDYRRVLNPGGIYVMAGGSMGRIFQGLVVGSILSVIGSKKFGILALKPNKDLAFLAELIEAGKVVPTIDSRYALSEAADALRHFGEGRFVGKIVITM
ncbi:MAG: NAD(P)-dependent alcohol dehydrogenase [Chloroflexi bacterium]|nr:NAD(P)-dependent alcohol dehydrogenase [Chloroflexota bacterium]